MKRIQPLDKSGREIKLGDLIVYSAALGRSAILQYGKILNIKFKPDRVHNPSTRDWEDAESPRYRVQGVYTTWDGVAALNQQGTLLFSDRILVIQRDQIPNAELNLLDTVTVPEPKQG
jgi:hypothetical protein